MFNFILALIFFSLSPVYATEVEIISAEFGVLDNEQRETLCLTIVREPLSGALYGLVEDIGDCFYARAAKHSSINTLKINFNALGPIDYAPLQKHLQAMDTQLEFLFSEGE